MKKIQEVFSCLVLFFFICNFCFSNEVIKDDYIVSKKNKIQHTMFLELYGSANNLYNLIYDCSFQLAEKHKLAVATGFGYLPLVCKGRNFDPYVGASFQVNYLLGEKNSHFEIGTGIIYPILLHSITYVYGNNQEVKWETCKKYGIPLRIGYRYQRTNGGIFWKIAIVPTYYHRDFYNGPIFQFAGVAIGYTFINKKE